MKNRIEFRTEVTAYRTNKNGKHFVGQREHIHPYLLFQSR